jgi:hypothetical protein
MMLYSDRMVTYDYTVAMQLMGRNRQSRGVRPWERESWEQSE